MSLSLLSQDCQTSVQALKARGNGIAKRRGRDRADARCPPMRPYVRASGWTKYRKVVKAHLIARARRVGACVTDRLPAALAAASASEAASVTNSTGTATSNGRQARPTSDIRASAAPHIYHSGAPSREEAFAPFGPYSD